MQKPEHHIISVLSYFDLFDYPITKEEIEFFLGEPCCEKELAEALQNLKFHGMIYKLDEFYSLRNDHSLVGRRRKGNERAVSQLQTAKKIGKLLARFPYVRGVAVSGSLSKNFADEISDVDLFIITAQNRLWVARTFMHLLKKLSFLFRKQHLLCMNYYIDEQHLEIKEKNSYTSTEIATLLPLQGKEVFERFHYVNDWVKNYLPNYTPRESEAEIRHNFLKRKIEKLFNNRFGDKLDDSMMKLTVKRWDKKASTKKKNKRGMRLGIESSKFYAKPDPKIFQENLLSLYDEKRKEQFIRLRKYISIHSIPSFLKEII